MRKNIYDDFNRVIGYTIKMGEETHIFNNVGQFLGKHLPMTDQVFNDLGKLVGKGIEVLGQLIKK